MPRPQQRKVADQLRHKLSKLARFLDEAEIDVLAYIIQRLNGEVRRRTDVVSIVRIASDYGMTG